MSRSILRALKPCAVALVTLTFASLLVLHRSYVVLPAAAHVSAHSNQRLRKLLQDNDTTETPARGANSSSQQLARRLPQCIIIGARKCGTRALLEFLNLHPQIVSPGDEMHFFSDDDAYSLGLDWYRHRMPYSRSDQVTVEKTPKYFISSASPERIRAMNSSIKLIVILRHPTTRVVSDYAQMCAIKQAHNQSVRSFENLVLDDDRHVDPEFKAVQISLYHRWLARWLDVFPREQLHVVDGDRLIREPVREIAKVESFLGLPHYVRKDSLYFNRTRGFYCMAKTSRRPARCLGVNKGRKHPKLNTSLLTKLDRFFRPHNERLFKLIGRRLDWR